MKHIRVSKRNANYEKTSPENLFKSFILVIIKYVHLTSINILILKYSSEIGMYYFSFSVREYRFGFQFSGVFTEVLTLSTWLIPVF